MKTMGNLIIDHATVVTPCGHSARKGVAMADLTTIKDGCVIVRDGMIEHVGPSVDAQEQKSEARSHGFTYMDAGAVLCFQGLLTVTRI